MNSNYKQIFDTEQVDTGTFNMFYLTDKATFWIGIFGQILSGITEFVSAFAFVYNSISYPILAAILGTITGIFFVVVFEIVGMRYYLVIVTRQIVKKMFSSVQAIILLILNIFLLLAILSGNVFLSYLGCDFTTKDKTSSNSIVREFRDKQQLRVDSITAKFDKKVSSTTLDFNSKRESIIEAFDVQLTSLVDAKATVKKDASKRHYDRKISKYTLQRIEKLELHDKGFTKAVNEIKANRDTTINRENRNYLAKEKDLIIEQSNDNDFWTVINNNIKWFLLASIILSAISIVYREIYLDASNVVVNYVEYFTRPSNIKKLITGLYNKAHYKMYQIVSKWTKHDKYDYVIGDENQHSITKLDNNIDYYRLCLWCDSPIDLKKRYSNTKFCNNKCRCKYHYHNKSIDLLDEKDNQILQLNNGKTSN